jgi:flagellar basal-body rod modification protein FlgD
MPTVSAISSSSSSSLAGSTGTAATRVPQRVLGQSDFLRLLATQFQTQDPLKPVEDTAFIAQMAQFSALEQSSVMSRDLAQLRADQRRVAANSYLGHRVTVDAGQGVTRSGDVTAIDATGAEPRLVINGQPYLLSAVLRVEPGVVPAPPPASPGGA